MCHKSINVYCNVLTVTKTRRKRIAFKELYLPCKTIKVSTLILQIGEIEADKWLAVR